MPPETTGDTGKDGEHPQSLQAGSGGRRLNRVIPTNTLNTSSQEILRQKLTKLAEKASEANRENQQKDPLPEDFVGDSKRASSDQNPLVEYKIYELNQNQKWKQLKPSDHLPLIQIRDYAAKYNGPNADTKKLFFIQEINECVNAYKPGSSDFKVKLDVLGRLAQELLQMPSRALCLVETPDEYGGRSWPAQTSQSTPGDSSTPIVPEYPRSKTP